MAIDGKQHYQKYRTQQMAYSRARYAANREAILAKERARVAAIKADPEKYAAYLAHRRELWAKRKAEGRTKENREVKRRWEAKNRHIIRAKTTARRRTDRIDALTAYGGKCACCNETRYEFLSIDHINGGGAQHRASLKPTDRREFPKYLKRMGYPADYRVLCHNCNQSLGLYGYCPHQERPVAAILAGEVVSVGVAK